MGKLTDIRGKPGDIVLTRGGQPVTVWRGFGDTRPENRAGTVVPGAMGLIVATHVTAWTYVLWSMPCICGWVHDGELKVVKVKTP